jgi:hypothetical protein
MGVVFQKLKITSMIGLAVKNLLVVNALPTGAQVFPGQ